MYIHIYIYVYNIYIYIYAIQRVAHTQALATDSMRAYKHLQLTLSFAAADSIHGCNWESVSAITAATDSIYGCNRLYLWLQQTLFMAATDSTYGCNWLYTGICHENAAIQRVARTQTANVYGCCSVSQKGASRHYCCLPGLRVEMGGEGGGRGLNVCVYTYVFNIYIYTTIYACTYVCKCMQTDVVCGHCGSGHVAEHEDSWYGHRLHKICTYTCICTCIHIYVYIYHISIYIYV